MNPLMDSGPPTKKAKAWLPSPLPKLYTPRPPASSPPPRLLKTVIGPPVPKSRLGRHPEAVAPNESPVVSVFAAAREAEFIAMLKNLPKAWAKFKMQ